MFESCKRGSLWVLVPLALALILACGGDDDDAGQSGDDDDGATATANDDGDGGEVEMVPLSSLNLDLPFEFSYDPPVPSDVTVSNAIEREASEGVYGGYDLTLSTSATYEEMKPAYDEYMAGLGLNSAIPASQAWSGRRAEGEPGITIAVIGEGRLNIAEILDN